MTRRTLLALLTLATCFLVNAQTPDSLSNERLSVHFQATVIRQMKPGFDAKYSGFNSLSPKTDAVTSLTSTLYMGLRLWQGAAVFLNPEIAGGSGLSGATGIAAASNGETYRIGDPAPTIYLARLYYRQRFALTDKKSYQTTDANQLAEWVPEKYLSVTFGKVSLADFFDDNKYAHDPRTQFMSWALMDNGAWDYPANTRGYTTSLVLEYVSPKNELRYSAALLPLVANGEDMNSNISKALSHTLEYTRRYAIEGKNGAVRVLGYFSTANMGNYRESIEKQPVDPDITSTEKYGRTKYGFGVNAEQDITSDLGCFLRAGWNDGHNETWCFTEIDRTLSGGLVLNGQRWKRSNDNIGLAYVISGLSQDHRDYLEAGGHGFIVGDGALNYAPEHLAELYYSAELKKNFVYATATYQFVINPAYNQDRGPVNIFSVRIHAFL